MSRSKEQVTVVKLIPEVDILIADKCQDVKLTEIRQRHVQAAVSYLLLSGVPTKPSAIAGVMRWQVLSSNRAASTRVQGKHELPEARQKCASH